MSISRVDLPHLVVSCMISVHHALGTGLPQQTYLDCLALEFQQREIFFTRDLPLKIVFHQREIQTQERIHFVVEDSLILMILGKPMIESEDKSKLFAWLRHYPMQEGFIVNFHAHDFRNSGLKRLVNAPSQS